jgi:hypothetical protein
VAAAQQMRQLAFHLGSGRPIVGQPDRVALAGAGYGQLGLSGVDGDHPTPQAGRAGLPQRADAARSTEPGSAITAAGWADRHRDPGRAGHGAGLEVKAELVFGEPPARGGRDLGLDHRRPPLLLQPGQMGAGA